MSDPISKKYYVRKAPCGTILSLIPVIQNGIHQQNTKNEYFFTVQTVWYKTIGHPTWIKENETICYHLDYLRIFDTEEEAIGWASLEAL